MALRLFLDDPGRDLDRIRPVEDILLSAGLQPIKRDSIGAPLRHGFWVSTIRRGGALTVQHVRGRADTRAISTADRIGFMAAYRDALVAADWHRVVWDGRSFMLTVIPPTQGDPS